jgi:hypothetical protein
MQSKQTKAEPSTSVSSSANLDSVANACQSVDPETLLHNYLDWFRKGYRPQELDELAYHNWNRYEWFLISLLEDARQKKLRFFQLEVVEVFRGHYPLVKDFAEYMPINARGVIAVIVHCSMMAYNHRFHEKDDFVFLLANTKRVIPQLIAEDQKLLSDVKKSNEKCANLQNRENLKNLTFSDQFSRDYFGSKISSIPMVSENSNPGLIVSEAIIQSSSNSSVKDPQPTIDSRSFTATSDNSVMKELKPSSRIPTPTIQQTFVKSQSALCDWDQRRFLFEAEIYSDHSQIIHNKPKVLIHIMGKTDQQERRQLFIHDCKSGVESHQFCSSLFVVNSEHQPRFLTVYDLKNYMDPLKKPLNASQLPGAAQADLRLCWLISLQGMAAGESLKSLEYDSTKKTVKLTSSKGTSKTFDLEVLRSQPSLLL